MGVALSVLHSILSWTLPVCVLGVIISDFRAMRRERIEFASLRTSKHSMSTFYILSIVLLVMTTITFSYTAGSAADMFVLSGPRDASGTEGPALGFNARMLFMPTFSVFLSMLMLNTWFGATGSRTRAALAAIGTDLAGLLLTLLVLAWGDQGVLQHERCLNLCPPVGVCACNRLRGSIPIVVIELLLVIAHAAATWHYWRATRVYSKLDEQHEVAMEGMESGESGLDERQTSLPSLGGVGFQQSVYA